MWTLKPRWHCLLIDYDYLVDSLIDLYACTIFEQSCLYVPRRVRIRRDIYISGLPIRATVKHLIAKPAPESSLQHRPRHIGDR